MISEENKLNVQTSGIDTKTFGISINKNIFSLLSEKIYSNPIRAVIREISANACDAHIQANKKEIPFEVHLPNILEPHFEIKDFGIGLSEEQIYSLYTQYGASNKTKSNDFCGMFGIGSKSPFSYTDSFLIESRFNNVKTIYTAFLNSEGIPSISEPISKNPTDESNGLSIKFSVQSKDINQFANEARTVFTYFEVKPTITGNIIKFEDRKYLIKTDNYSVYTSNGYDYNHSVIIMGNISYPIDVASLKLAVYRKREDQNTSNLLNYGVEIYSNIGDVNITASRESLFYDDKTINFIKKKCFEIIKDIEIKFNQEIKDCKNIWEASKKASSFKDFHYLQLDLNWQGKKLEKHIHIPSNITLKSLSVPYGNKLRNRSVQNYHFDSNGRFFYKDQKGSYNNLVNAVRNKSLNSAFYFETIPDDLWLETTGFKYVLEKASSLPKPERKTAVRTKSEHAKIYKFKNITYGNSVQFWEPFDLDLNETGKKVYVEISFFNRKRKNGSIQQPRELSEQNNILKELKFDNIIYGIKTSELNIIKKSKSNWIEFDDYRDECLLGLDKLYKENALKVLDFRSFSYKSLLEFDNSSLDKTKDFDKFILDLKEAQKLINDPNIANYLRLKSDFKSNRLNEKYIELTNKYKLLPYIYNSIYRSNADNIYQNYIKLIDGEEIV